MVAIGVYQSLSNRSMYEQRCLENIEKLYEYSGKCDYQQQYKSILEASMVYNPEGFTDNCQMSPRQYMTSKKHSAIKSLRQILEALEVKPKTDVRRFLCR